MDDVTQPQNLVKPPRKGMPYRKYLPAAPLFKYFSPEMNDKDIAAAMGTTRRRIHDFRLPNFHITWLEADRYAIAIGLHPLYIWGDLWIEEVSPVERQVRPEVVSSPSQTTEDT